MRYLGNAILMPTWLHVGANMGPCWLKKNVLTRLGPFWRPLGPSCLEARGGLGGAAPPALQAD